MDVVSVGGFCVCVDVFVCSGGVCDCAGGAGEEGNEDGCGKFEEEEEGEGEEGGEGGVVVRRAHTHELVGRKRRWERGVKRGERSGGGRDRYVNVYI